MRLTPIQVPLSDDDWHFIIDCMIDRLENLTELNEGDYNMQGQFADDIARCNSIMDAVEAKLAD